MSVFNTSVRTALGVLCLTVFAAGAQAAPQILGLVATLGPTPLVCENGICRAEFSSFCLQQERDIPHTNWKYEFGPGEQPSLVLQMPDGSERRIAAGPHAKVRAPRGFAAVEIAVPQEIIASFGAVSVALDIGASVNVVPVAQPGDDSPISEQEKALAAGPLRQAGRRIVDRDPEVVLTARVLNGMINALPKTIHVGEGAKARLWNRSLASGLVPGEAEARTVARTEYDSCWQNLPVSFGIESVRHCLQVRHDAIMVRKNRAYWKAVRTGS